MLQLLQMLTKPYCWLRKDEKYNEIGWAKEFSKYIGKENISKVITPEEYWGNISKFSIIWTNRLLIRHV